MTPNNFMPGDKRILASRFIESLDRSVKEGRLSPSARAKLSFDGDRIFDRKELLLETRSRLAGDETDSREAVRALLDTSPIESEICPNYWRSEESGKGAREDKRREDLAEHLRIQKEAAEARIERQIGERNDPFHEGNEPEVELGTLWAEDRFGKEYLRMLKSRLNLPLIGGKLDVQELAIMSNLNSAPRNPDHLHEILIAVSRLARSQDDEQDAAIRFADAEFMAGRGLDQKLYFHTNRFPDTVEERALMAWARWWSDASVLAGEDKLAVNDLFGFIFPLKWEFIDESSRFKLPKIEPIKELMSSDEGLGMQTVKTFGLLGSALLLEEMAVDEFSKHHLSLLASLTSCRNGKRNSDEALVELMGAIGTLRYLEQLYPFDALKERGGKIAKVIKQIPISKGKSRDDEEDDEEAERFEITQIRSVAALRREEMRGLDWFFKAGSLGQFDDRLDAMGQYRSVFQKLPVLPRLYCAFADLGEGERVRLAEEFSAYRASINEGRKPQKAPELPEAVMEEVTRYAINSAQLNSAKYEKTMSDLVGKEIPEPNFHNRFSLTVGTYRREERELDDKEKEKASKWIGNLGETETSKLIAGALVSDLGLLELNDGGLGPLNAQLDGPMIQALRSSKDWEGLQAYLTERVSNAEFDKGKALRAIFESRCEGKITVKEMKRSLPLLVRALAEENPEFKDQVASLRQAEVLGTAQMNTLSDVNTELLSNTPPGARDAMEQALDSKAVWKLAMSVRVQSKNHCTIDFLPAKTQIDAFYGYFGGTCLVGNPEEILNPAFTPVRMKLNERIEGVVHTLTLDIRGEKALILPGIEPKKGIVSKVDPEELVRGIIQRVTHEVAIPNGYDLICLPLDEGALANKREILEPLKKVLAEHPERIIQDVQPGFPKEYSEDNIRELAVIWRREK